MKRSHGARRHDLVRAVRGRVRDRRLRATSAPARPPRSRRDRRRAGRHGEQSEFFVQEDYDKQLAQRVGDARGRPAKPWTQVIEPEMVDTSEYKAEGSGWNVCFSNAAVDNPWRQVGWNTMQAEVELHKEIAKFKAVDAEAKDDKQISDIEATAPAATATRSSSRRTPPRR